MRCGRGLGVAGDGAIAEPVLEEQNPALQVLNLPDQILQQLWTGRGGRGTHGINLSFGAHFRARQTVALSISRYSLIRKCDQFKARFK